MHTRWNRRRTILGPDGAGHGAPRERLKDPQRLGPSASVLESGRGSRRQTTTDVAPRGVALVGWRRCAGRSRWGAAGPVHELSLRVCLERCRRSSQLRPRLLRLDIVRRNGPPPLARSAGDWASGGSRARRAEARGRCLATSRAGARCCAEREECSRSRSGAGAGCLHE